MTDARIERTGRFLLGGLLVVCALVLYSMTASAFGYNQLTRNAYSFNPLEGVLVSAYNSTGDLVDSDTTLTDGEVSLTLPGDTYTITSVKIGYNSESMSVLVNATTSKIVYMTYDSAEVVRIVYSDYTFGARTICLFNEENRLFGCFEENDTSILIPEGNYTVQVKGEMIDEAATATGGASLLARLLPILLAVVIIGGLIIIALIVIIMFGRRMLR